MTISIFSGFHREIWGEGKSPSSIPAGSARVEVSSGGQDGEFWVVSFASRRGSPLSRREHEVIELGNAGVGSRKCAERRRSSQRLQISLRERRKLRSVRRRATRYRPDRESTRCGQHGRCGRAASRRGACVDAKRARAHSDCSCASLLSLRMGQKPAADSCLRRSPV